MLNEFNQKGFFYFVMSMDFKCFFKSGHIQVFEKNDLDYENIQNSSFLYF